MLFTSECSINKFRNKKKKKTIHYSFLICFNYFPLSIASTYEAYGFRSAKSKWNSYQIIIWEKMCIVDISVASL